MGCESAMVVVLVFGGSYAELFALCAVYFSWRWETARADKWHINAGVETSKSALAGSAILGLVCCVWWVSVWIIDVRILPNCVCVCVPWVLLRSVTFLVNTMRVTLEAHLMGTERIRRSANTRWDDVYVYMGASERERKKDRQKPFFGPMMKC